MGDINLAVIMVSAGNMSEDGLDFWTTYTKPAIHSLNHHSAEHYELVVVDNGGCGRGDLNYDVMVPYAQAVNQAVELVSKSLSRLLILNNDIIVNGPWQKQIYTSPLCGPKILRKEGIDYIEGWALSVDRELWHMLGGFNEIFANSWEDVDFCWRASRLGIPPMKINNWPVYHHWGATRNKIKGSNRWDGQNRLYLLERIKASNGKRWKRK